MKDRYWMGDPFRNRFASLCGGTQKSTAKGAKEREGGETLAEMSPRIRIPWRSLATSAVKIPDSHREGRRIAEVSYFSGAVAVVIPVSWWPSTTRWIPSRRWLTLKLISRLASPPRFLASLAVEIPVFHREGREGAQSHEGVPETFYCVCHTDYSVKSFTDLTRGSIPFTMGRARATAFCSVWPGKDSMTSLTAAIGSPLRS